MRARTSYRDIFLLACCQALLLTNASGLITMNGLVGFSLAEHKTLATLGAFAVWLHSFALYCAATAVIGIYNAAGLQYRFAAAEVATVADKARAISWVLAGGIAGGFLGPESIKLSRDLFATPFVGSFLVLAAYALVALAVQSRVHVPRLVIESESAAGRPLAVIARQPVFIVAALAGAPGFFTGSLIKRFGVLKVIVTGAAVMATRALVAINGNTIAHFVTALILVGFGWNFLYTGGTTLLTEAHTSVEKARTQGLNDLIVFTTMAVSSLSSGRW